MTSLTTFRFAGPGYPNQAQESVISSMRSEAVVIDIYSAEQLSSFIHEAQESALPLRPIHLRISVQSVDHYADRPQALNALLPSLLTLVNERDITAAMIVSGQSNRAQSKNLIMASTRILDVAEDGAVSVVKDLYAFAAQN